MLEQPLVFPGATSPGAEEAQTDAMATSRNARGCWCPRNHPFGWHTASGQVRSDPGGCSKGVTPDVQFLC
eukprot:393672-Prorocentrum_lima.AAC.1